MKEAGLGKGGVIRWFRGERGMGGMGAGSGERIAILFPHFRAD
jgi:hypothetical protein